MNSLTKHRQIKKDQRLMQLRGLIVPELHKIAKRTKYDSSTELAEYTAQSLGMPHWLDQPNHIIWDLARIVCRSIAV